VRLVVIDAANCLYRAFFAIPPLRAPDGFPTNAVFGFVNMIRKVVREEAPDAVVIAFDPPGPSFRESVYPEYKAHRDALPEDLGAQIAVARELAEAWRIPVLEAPGFEADDVIATLVAQAPSDLEIAIVSTDKDLFQLVSDRVRLLDTMRERRIGPAEVQQRFGVPPERVLDVRALAGDASDNIPGVPGIGEKGASRLIAEWGDLENLLAHAAEVPGKRAREALLAHAEEARLSRRLAALRTDAPVPRDLAALRRGEPDRAALARLFQRLGFLRLLEELAAESGAAAATSPAPAPVQTELVTAKDAWERLLAELQALPRLSVLPLGAEQPGGLPGEPVGFAFALGEGRAASVLLRRRDLAAGSGLEPEVVFQGLRLLLEGPSAKAWSSRDTKRLQSILAEGGVSAALPAFDVEIAAFLLDPSAARGTPALATRFLGREVPAWEDVAGRGAKARPAEALAPDALAAWAGAEVCAIHDLRLPLAAALERDGLRALFDDVERPLTAVLSAMEREGVRIDEAALRRLSAEFAAELERIEARIQELAGERFQVSSPKQLQRILFEKLKLAPLRRTKTGFSTDEAVLEQLAAQHELPAYVLAHRRLTKLRSTWVEALPPLVNPRTGRIHPVFHQTGAATGRLSSSSPNVQNIPVRGEEGLRIRAAFIPAEGRVFVSADYSQVELRILAHFSGDESLCEAFRSGDDVHRRTAAEVRGVAPSEVGDEERARAKAVNFGIIYGLSAFGLANQLGIASADAQATIDAYFARYAGVRRFLDETVRQARAEGFVRTLLGRRRYLPDLASRNRVLRGAAERMAVNTVIQGTAADLIKKAMVEIAAGIAARGLASRAILQVHDELVFEAPPEEVEALSALVRERMEGVHALRVPLRVEIGTGRSWREAH
jgi:DNA polymerase-1